MTRRRRARIVLEPAPRPRSPTAISVYLCLRCSSPLSEQARAIGVSAAHLRAAMLGRYVLTEAESVRADAWLDVVWLRYLARQGEAIAAEDEARARACATLVGVEVVTGSAPPHSK